MAMPNIPTFDTPNVAQSYAVLGGKIKQSLGNTLQDFEEMNSFLQKKEAKDMLINALKTEYPEIEVSPYTTVETLARGFSQVREIEGQLEKLKKIDPEYSNPQLTKYRNMIFNASPDAVKQVKKAWEDEISKKEGQTAEQKGLAAVKGLGPKATQEEYATTYSEATEGGPLTETAKLAITGGEKPISPYSMMSLSASRQSKENEAYLKAVTEAGNALKDINSIKNSKKSIKEQKTKLHAQWEKFNADPMNDEQDLEYYRLKKEDPTGEKAEAYKKNIIVTGNKQFDEADKALTEQDKGFGEEVKSFNNQIKLLEQQFGFSLDLQKKGLQPKTTSSGGAKGGGF